MSGDSVVVDFCACSFHGVFEKLAHLVFCRLVFQFISENAFYLFEGLCPRCLNILRLYNMKSEIGFNDPADLPWFQRKGRIFERICLLAPCKITEISTFYLGFRVFGILFCKLCEVFTFFQPFEDFFCLAFAFLFSSSVEVFEVFIRMCLARACSGTVYLPLTSS